MSWQLDANSGTMQWVNDGVGDPSAAGKAAAEGKSEHIVGRGNARPSAPAQPKPESFGSSAYEPNPDFIAWKEKRARLVAELAAVRVKGAFGGSDQGRIQEIQAQISQLDANRPPETRLTGNLGQHVGAAQSAGAAAVSDIRDRFRSLESSALGAVKDAAAVTAQAQAQANASAGRQAPTMAPESAATVAAQQEAIGQLNNFNAATQGADALRNFAAQQPTGPSQAQAMLTLQAARDRAAALSRARSVRGGAGSVAEAMKTAQAEASAIGADTRMQKTALAAQEMAQQRGEQLQALQAAGQMDLQGSQQELAARQAVVEATSRVRDQDINVLRSNLDSRLQTMGLNDNQVRFFTGLGEAARQQAVQAVLDAQSKGIDASIASAAVQAQFAELAWKMLTVEQQAVLQKMGLDAQIDMANQQARQSFLGQILGFLGTGLMAGAAASDRRVKKNIEKVRSMADALRKTAGHSWDYKSPEKHGKGRYTGPMAQDLEKVPEFRSAVSEKNGVKMVDATRLVMTHHAALHDLQKQIDRIKGRKEKQA